MENKWTAILNGPMLNGQHTHLCCSFIIIIIIIIIIINIIIIIIIIKTLFILGE